MATVDVDLEKDYLLVSFSATNGVGNGVVNGHGREKDGANAYPFAWLRENCQCAECCHWLTRERLFLLRNLDADIQPSSYKVSNCDSNMVV